MTFLKPENQPPVKPQEPTSSSPAPTPPKGRLKVLALISAIGGALVLLDNVFGVQQKMCDWGYSLVCETNNVIKMDGMFVSGISDKQTKSFSVPANQPIPFQIQNPKAYYPDREHANTENAARTNELEYEWQLETTPDPQLKETRVTIPPYPGVPPNELWMKFPAIQKDGKPYKIYVQISCKRCAPFPIMGPYTITTQSPPLPPSSVVSPSPIPISVPDPEPAAIRFVRLYLESLEYENPEKTIASVEKTYEKLSPNYKDGTTRDAGVEITQEYFGKHYGKPEKGPDRGYDYEPESLKLEAPSGGNTVVSVMLRDMNPGSKDYSLSRQYIHLSQTGDVSPTGDRFRVECVTRDPNYCPNQDPNQG